jgi:hypothetical protein
VELENAHEALDALLDTLIRRGKRVP